jgi:hypothetical protein
MNQTSLCSLVNFTCSDLWLMTWGLWIQVDTHTHTHGCGFAWEQVQAALENSRVAHDIPYSYNVE